jgi:predicted NBD/HSP70 family sugar kinase
MTGLRGSTLTYIMRELLDQHLLVTAGKRECRSVGKKQVLLEISKEVGWTVGIELRADHAVYQVHNLPGQVLDTFRVDLPRKLPAVVKRLKKALEERFHEKGWPVGRPLGVGVGIPGIVDCHSGVILFSSLYQARDYPLAEELAAYFDGPVVVDHDANLAILSESRRGVARPLNTFLYFLLQHEVQPAGPYLNAFGSALFLNGEIFRGHHYAAGEMDQAVAPANFQFESRSELAPLEDETGGLTPSLRTLAGSLGHSIAHLVNLLDPEAVVIGADMIIRNKRFLQIVTEQAQKTIIPLPRRTVKILPAAWGGDAVSMGGAIAAAEIALWGGGDFGQPDEARILLHAQENPGEG